MDLNPEFRRNLWLEISPLRLAGMPLVLGLVFLLTFVTDDYSFADKTSTVAALLFWGLSFIWGMRLASESVLSEIRDRTWDGQRMSVISPWNMAWGKLLGSTIYTWYGAMLCLIVYVFSKCHLSNYIAGMSTDLVIKSALVMAGAGLLGQSVAMLASLLSIRKDRRFSRSMASAFFALGLMIAILALNFGSGKFDSFVWAGIRFESINFGLLSILMFLIWTIVGIYRLMRLELQMKNLPFVWLGFVVFLMMYAAGFTSRSSELSSGSSTSFYLSIAYAVAALLVYLTALVEPKDPVRFRRLIRLWEERDWRQFLESSPCWLTALPVFFVAGVLLLAFPPVETSYAITDIRLASAASMFFLLRDLAIILYCNLGKSRKRADVLAVLWLALLYLVIPMILNQLELVYATHSFWPTAGPGVFASLIAAPVEMLLVGWLALRRWRENYEDKSFHEM